MGSVNKAFLIGHLGQDPELRQTGGGQAVCNFSLATSESWKDKSTGEKMERTEWHRIVVWGPQADACSRFLGKGSMVCVMGRIQTRKWQDKEGQDRYTTEIQADDVRFLSPAKGGGSNSGGGAQHQQNVPDDGIPF